MTMEDVSFPYRRVKNTACFLLYLKPVLYEKLTLYIDIKIQHKLFIS